MPLGAIRPSDPSWRKASRTSLGGTTSASSAFPRSERVYPAIMPLGAISPSDPSWRKASRYVLGRDDLRVVRIST